MRTMKKLVIAQRPCYLFIQCSMQEKETQKTVTPTRYQESYLILHPPNHEDIKSHYFSHSRFGLSRSTISLLLYSFLELRRSLRLHIILQLYLFSNLYIVLDSLYFVSARKAFDQLYADLPTMQCFMFQFPI